MDVEATIAKHTAQRAVFLGPVILAVFWATRGIDGLMAAAIGLTIVVGNFLLAGGLLSVAARISLSLYHAAALFGFILRLGLIALAVLIISRLVELDRLAFGVTVVVAYLGLLTWEAIAVAKGAERELEWTD
ncbi:MAG: ATP synthase subunit I [Acidimicrobiia bacterium]|nr:ATP synthase subunit I [Acidimicrobiia bacterium]